MASINWLFPTLIISKWRTCFGTWFFSLAESVTDDYSYVVTTPHDLEWIPTVYAIADILNVFWAFDDVSRATPTYEFL